MSYRALAAALALATAAPWACATNPSADAPALHGLPSYPVAPAQRAQAELTAQTGVTPCGQFPACTCASPGTGPSCGA
ncbi:hypothetical protein [Thiomonas sp. 13-64-67]|uniref:hypothetical protein n=1 Tax=Thiomonas sp. 13-64-67 TaxID=1970447 RepID=UPI0025795659|nr:hypothetical protein [Thiomonas sp. 13-64-67]